MRRFPIPRGHFDHRRDLVATRRLEIRGEVYQPGDLLPADKVPFPHNKRLWEQRMATYRVEYSNPPVPPVTRPVREIIEQRKARDPDYAAALDDEKRSEALDRLQSLGQELGQTPIPADWREQHHKTIVKLANDLGADVKTKKDAIAAIEAELKRRGD